MYQEPTTSRRQLQNRFWTLAPLQNNWKDSLGCCLWLFFHGGMQRWTDMLMGTNRHVDSTYKCNHISSRTMAYVAPLHPCGGSTYLGMKTTGNGSRNGKGGRETKLVLRDIRNGISRSGNYQLLYGRLTLVNYSKDAGVAPAKYKPRSWLGGGLPVVGLDLLDPTKKQRNEENNKI